MPFYRGIQRSSHPLLYVERQTGVEYNEARQKHIVYSITTRPQYTLMGVESVLILTTIDPIVLFTQVRHANVSIIVDSTECGSTILLRDAMLSALPKLRSLKLMWLSRLACCEAGLQSSLFWGTFEEAKTTLPSLSYVQVKTLKDQIGCCYRLFCFIKSKKGNWLPARETWGQGEIATTCSNPIDF